MKIQLGFWITNQCNGKCPYCYASSATEQDELNLTLGKNILSLFEKKAGAMNMAPVVLTGGEPLLSPSLETWTELIQSFGLKYILYTNGTRLYQFIDSFKKNPPHYIRISLDSFSHSSLRPGIDLEWVFKNIELLEKEVPNVPIVIYTMGTKENLKNHKAWLERLLRYKNIKSLYYNMPVPQGRAEQMDWKVYPELSEYVMWGKKILRDYFEKKYPIHLGMIHLYDGAHKIISKVKSLDQSPCSYRNNFFYLDYKGNYYKCPDLHALPLAKFEAEDSLEELERKILKSREHPFYACKLSEVKEACVSEGKTCRYWELCYGGCPAWKKSFLGKDLKRCELYPLLEEHIWPLLKTETGLDFQDFLREEKACA